MSKPQNFTMPKTLGACADRLYEIKQQRLAAQRIVDDMGREEKALREHIIETLPKSDQTGASGRIANVRVISKTKPTVEDWDALYKHIKRTGSFELLQRRVSEEAAHERWDAGKEIPGIGRFQAVTLSLTKVG